MWLLDPKDKKPSVSLTLLVISVLALIIVGSLEIMNKINTTSIFEQFFYTQVALYFGRRSGYVAAINDKVSKTLDKIGDK
jgi:predicted permease